LEFLKVWAGLHKSSQFQLWQELQKLFDLCECLPSSTLKTEVWIKKQHQGRATLFFVSRIDITKMQIDNAPINPDFLAASKKLSKKKMLDNAVEQLQPDDDIVTFLEKYETIPKRGRPRKILPITQVEHSLKQKGNPSSDSEMEDQNLNDDEKNDIIYAKDIALTSDEDD
jgi:hypothetical protein